MLIAGVTAPASRFVHGPAALRLARRIDAIPHRCRIWRLNGQQRDEEEHDHQFSVASLRPRDQHRYVTPAFDMGPRPGTPRISYRTDDARRMARSGDKMAASDTASPRITSRSGF